MDIVRGAKSGRKFFYDQIREKTQTQAVRQVRCQDPFFHFPYGNLCFGLYPGRYEVWDEDIPVETLVQ